MHCRPHCMRPRPRCVHKVATPHHARLPRPLAAALTPRPYHACTNAHTACGRARGARWRAAPSTARNRRAVPRASRCRASAEKQTQSPARKCSVRQVAAKGLGRKLDVLSGRCKCKPRFDSNASGPPFFNPPACNPSRYAVISKGASQRL
eukprot:366520-Chlamydomonas_euryale.AAC.20